MRRSVAFPLLLLFMASDAAADICQWTDANGVTHFDSPDQVPAQYRSQCKTSGGSSTPAAKPAGAKKAAPSASAPSSLKTFEIPYTNEGSTKRVIIPVTFNDSVTAPMALDTGAPGLVMSVDLALRLRLFSQGRGNLLVASGGIGGTAPGILTITDAVSIADARTKVVPTTVVDNLSTAFEGLIGMDVLAGYNVTIDAKRQVVVFQEHPPDPNARGGHDEAWWRTTFQEFRETRDRWVAYAKSLDNARVASDRRAFAEFQKRESEQLLLKLHQHASDAAVPQEWR